MFFNVRKRLLIFAEFTDDRPSRASFLMLSKLKLLELLIAVSAGFFSVHLILDKEGDT